MMILSFMTRVFQEYLSRILFSIIAQIHFAGKQKEQGWKSSPALFFLFV